MSEAFIKFKEIVDRSQTFAVSAGETLDVSKLLAAATLSSALKKIGKISAFDNEDAPENFQKFISAILEEEFYPKAVRENIIIKFDSRTVPVKELKYEKDGDTVKIILEGKTQGLDVSNIRIEKEIVPVDLLLLLDPKESDIENILARNPHKEVVKIGAKEKSFPLKLTEIIKALFGGSAPENIKEALWFLIEEEEKINQTPSSEGFLALKELWDSGVNKDKILKAREEIFSGGFNRLLGRALSRSHFEKEISTFWSFLPKADFQKTGTGAWALINILKELRALNTASKFYALLWNSEGDEVSAILASPDRAGLAGLAASFATFPASSYFIANSFKSFSEAEIKIRNSIRQIILS